MAFSSEEEQLRKFRNDEIAQHYFEVLRTLISKKSIFAQNIGLYDVAAYLGEIFSGVGLIPPWSSRTGTDMRFIHRRS